MPVIREARFVEECALLGFLGKSGTKGFLPVSLTASEEAVEIEARVDGG